MDLPRVSLASLSEMQNIEGKLMYHSFNFPKRTPHNFLCLAFQFGVQLVWLARIFAISNELIFELLRGFI